MTGNRTPLDLEAREKIRIDLGRTLVVEAGAGTGKTQSLVERIVSLVTRGEASLDRIAAITFTRYAASQLRDRVRSRLEEHSRSAGVPDADRERLDRALEEIDYAAIQTIDSFALSLLRERPLEAGLPPVITPLDEIEAELAFRDEWTGWLDRELEGEGPLASAVSGAVRLGLWNPVPRLYDVAWDFHQNRDLIGASDFAAEGDVPRVAAGRIVDAIPDLRTLLTHAPGGDDRLEPHVRNVLAFAEDLRSTGPDSSEATVMLAERLRLKTRLGQKNAWGVDDDGASVAQRIKDLLVELEDRAEGEIAALRAGVLGRMLQEIVRFVLDYADRRRRDGAAEFHDMLIWARDMLRDSPSAASHFRRRYTHVLIDEFQDTDPLQTDLARLLAGGAGGGNDLRPGALFLVGDPKQSIYRFRRADVAAMAGILGQMPGERVHLTHNFRAHTRLVEWCNGVFSSWMDVSGPHQAEYVDLQTDAAAPPADPPLGAHFIGGPLDAPSIDAVRRIEARDIARIAREVCAGAWGVRQSDDPRETCSSRPGDLCILFPSRTSLRYLEDALEEAGVPFSLEGQSLVFLTQEVRDLVNCLAAIDDPSDQVSLVAALRSAAFGCSDVDLWRWKQVGGRFDYLAERPTDGPVSRALSALRECHERRMTMSTPRLVEEFVRCRRLRELACSGPGRRERWRRIELVIEQARALADAGRPSLREFLDWARERAERGTRMPEGGATSDADTVRLMTVHQAKGLEFPIVLLAGLNVRRPHGPGNVIYGRTPGDVGVRLAGGLTGFRTDAYERLAAEETEAERQERVRLMYVACTRACDHLIVSMFDQADARGERLTAQFAEHTRGAERLWREAAPLKYRQPASRAVVAEPFGDPARREEWIAAREEDIRRAAQPGTVSASSLERPRENVPAAPKEEYAEREAEPWRRGRAATAIGRAVHAALQEVDLATAKGLAAIAERCARAEAIPDHIDEVRALAEATLSAGIVRRAADAESSGRWLGREVYVSADLDGAGALEGIIDLLFEDGAGALVLVDFKTDRVAEDGSLRDAADPYLPQLGAYAEAVRRATDRDVSEAWIVFARRAAAGLDAEYRIPDIAAAAEGARGLAVGMLHSG